MVEVFSLLTYVSPLILAGATLISISVAVFPFMRESTKEKINVDTYEKISGKIGNKVSGNVSQYESTIKFKKELEVIRKIEITVLVLLFLSELFAGAIYIILTRASNISSITDELSFYFKLFSITSYVFLFLAIVFILYFYIRTSHVCLYGFKVPTTTTQSDIDAMMTYLYNKGKP